MKYVFGKDRESKVIIRKDENGQKQKRKNIGIIVAALLVVYVLLWCFC